MSWVGELDKYKTLINPFVFPSEITFYFLLMVVQTVNPLLWLVYSVLNSLKPLKLQYLIYFLSLLSLPVCLWVFHRYSLRSRVLRYLDKSADEHGVDSAVRMLCSRLGVSMPTIVYSDREDVDGFVAGFRRYYLVLQMGSVSCIVVSRSSSRP
mgnify:CR=1 FL=1